MKHLRGTLRWITLVLVWMVVAGCNPAAEGGEVTPLASEVATTVPTDAAVQIPTLPPSETTATTEEQAPTESPIAEAAPASVPCEGEVCIESGTFLLSRPIGPQGRNTVNPANRFGEYQRATKQAQRGVYFLNSSGTPVLAAADGLVVVAGNDNEYPYTKILGFLGNLVILEHNLPGISKPVYTLYAHLEEILVSEGAQVQVGQEIGKVGSSGKVTGSTLYFEVRNEENTYEAASNPELWLELLSDGEGQSFGALAGRILDAQDHYVEIPNIVLERLAGPGLPALEQIYIKSYTSQSLAGRPPWYENFAMGDLPAGSYQITFLYSNQEYQKVIEIQPGKLTVVTFRLE